MGEGFDVEAFGGDVHGVQLLQQTAFLLLPLHGFGHPATDFRDLYYLL